MCDGEFVFENGILYIVSACLLGENCKYTGGNNLVLPLKNKIESGGVNYLAVCPEVTAGLGIPREPMEIRNGSVMGRSGRDYTVQLRSGVAQVLNQIQTVLDEMQPDQRICELNEADSKGDWAGRVIAILKARSPSCGFGGIYDGTFTGKQINADGIFAAMLHERGADIYVK